MRLLNSLLISVLLGASFAASADVMPPETIKAWMRLKEHPNVYDRVESLCQGKKPKDACTIPGSAFSGGGAGTCKNEVNNETLTIDLNCVLNDRIWVDRQLPDGETGFVHDPQLCAQGNNPDLPFKLSCTPLATPPADRFCTGKAVGSPCTAILGNGGQYPPQEGTCERFTERKGFYYLGKRVMTREVIQCQPPALAPKVFIPVGWWQKLFM